MTRIYNDPSDFAPEVIDGFAAAYGRYVDRVQGASGFVRRGGPRAGKVSLVVGGGSGHYPSYAGIVGTGFADGCVLGNVFASPSAEQVYRIGRAAAGDSGLMLSFGNYAGDRLNFAAARERLIAEGIDTRIVYVTDDIASAAPEESDKRRGIAGTFTIYKIGGAAADRGHDLDTVERLMTAANSATYSFGVAFAGCTLPGQREPLFAVEEGQMEFGLGIHGEPGIRTAPWMPARELAAALVDAVLAERPAAAGGRAAVIVNGLGATKYEELFLVYGHIGQLLTAAGVEPVLPEVGELVTSLNMAGCSLSVTWLDDELESLWSAPADTASFRRGNSTGFPAFAPVATARARSEVDSETVEASDDSVAAARVARLVLAALTEVAVDNEEHLGQIDAVAGDGDHGVGMLRGLRAAQAAAEGSAGGIGTTLRAAGDAFADQAGGTSGILWGVFLSAIGTTLGDTAPVSADALRAAVRDGAESIQRAGKAELGDKTMLDALLPFVDRLDAGIESGATAAEAWRAAAVVAVDAAAATSSLVPKIGRARPLAERSVGTPDAGATSMGLLVTAAGGVIADAPCDI